MALRRSLAGGLVLVASTAMAQSIDGTAMFRERMTARVAPAGNPPIAFTIRCEPAKIVPERRYAVRGRILLEEKLLFTTDTATPVITAGNPAKMSLMLRRAGGAQTPPPAAAPATPLVGTHWRASELEGRPVPAKDPKGDAHLVFEAGGRVAGSDGCNRITGSYDLKGDVVAFGKMAATLRACMDTGGTERAFREALERATRLAITGDRLELRDASGTPLAAFTALADATPPGLQGASWQLVKFEGGDDTILKPDDGAKYTIRFGAGGQLTARIDCNRGRGTWKSGGANELQFGPLALTRAKCPAGSLHDRIVKQWPYVRSYVIRDGHLFLSLMADGGTYEFEPAREQTK